MAAGAAVGGLVPGGSCAWCAAGGLRGARLEQRGQALACGAAQLEGGACERLDREPRDEDLDWVREDDDEGEAEASRGDEAIVGVRVEHIRRDAVPKGRVASEGDEEIEEEGEAEGAGKDEEEAVARGPVQLVAQDGDGDLAGEGEGEGAEGGEGAAEGGEEEPSTE